MMVKDFKLNTFHLKAIAVVAMLIDHIAYVLIPNDRVEYWIMRMIGRIAAPLFWYCFAEGYRHTSNRMSYVGRLLVGCLAMMIGNGIIGGFVDPSLSIDPIQPNMFATFFLLALIIFSIEEIIKEPKIIAKCVLLLCVALFGLTTGFSAEYGWYALFSMLCFYFVKKDWLKYLLFIAINVTLCVIDRNFVQMFMILAIPFISLCSKEKPRRGMKYFFYIFYPLHFWILIIIGQFLK